jgi:hypothetical protein
LNQTLEAGDTDLPARQMLSAFSGLALLCVLLVVVFASTFIASGGGAQATPNSAPRVLQGDSSPVESVKFYLLDSEAQLEEIKQLVELGADHLSEMHMQPYPRFVTLLARTQEEDTLADARIAEEVRSREGHSLSVAVLDLRTAKPE